MSAQVMGIMGNGYSSLLGERATHGANISTSSYIPYLGMVLKGDHSNSVFSMPDARMYYANQAIADVKIQRNYDNVRTAAKNDSNSDYSRQTYDLAPTPTFEFVASLKKQLWIEAKAKQAQQEFIANGGQLPNAEGIPPYLVSQMYAKLSPYQGSVPPGGADSATNVVGPLTQIPFIQDVLGFPTPEYHINELTTKTSITTVTR